MKPEFCWDPAKADSNFVKHGILFPTAILAFSDPNAVTELERYDDGEERWQTIGQVNGEYLLLVVHTNWFEGELEIIRIISARKAVKHERKKYEGQFGSLQD